MSAWGATVPCQYALASPAPRRTTPTPDPITFARKLNTLHLTLDPGDPDPAASREPAVRKLLGPPDEVGSRGPDQIFPGMRTLRYGVIGKGKLCTLGEVFLDRLGQVVGLRGVSIAPIPPRTVPPQKLHDLLLKLDAVTDPTLPEADGAWDPRAYLTAVNELQALGPKQAKAVIREYCRVTSIKSAAQPYFPERDPAALVVTAALFSKPDFPYSGSHQLNAASGFPLLVDKLDTRETVAAPNVLLECPGTSFLQSPLAPPADPIPAMNRIEASGKGTLRRLRVQALRLVRPALVDAEPLALRKELDDAEMDRRWRATLSLLGSKRLRWRPEQNAYRETGRQP